MLSRFEIEGAPLGENSVESEEDEEEVWLFWKDNNKEIRSKSIRELAQDAKEGQKEDQEVVSYYRYGPQWIQSEPWWHHLLLNTHGRLQRTFSLLQVPAEPVCQDVFGPTVPGYQQDLRPAGRRPDPAVHV